MLRTLLAGRSVRGSHRHIHLESTRQPASQSSLARRAPDTYITVKTALAAKRPHGALKSFKQELGRADARTLERCIQLFGVHGAHDAMLDATKAFVAAGFTPSVSVWNKVLKWAPVSQFELAEMGAGNLPEFEKESNVAAWMTYFARTGDLQASEELFARYEKYLQEKDEVPGVAVWNALIDGRGRIGDLQGAKDWFDVWRTGKAHPYGSMELDSKSLEKPSARLRARRSAPVLGSPIMPRALRTSFRSSTAARLAHTVTEIPPPSPAPYVTLLKHIVDYGPTRRSPALSLLGLMAADRVPLTTSVVNGMMHHEGSSAESSMRRRESILSLYGLLRRNIHGDSNNANNLCSLRGGEETMLPDAATFAYVFEAYEEFIADESRPIHHARSTRLARRASLPPPDSHLIASPRFVFADMITLAASHSRPNTLLSTELLDKALRAFINARDYAAACVVLDSYAIHGLEPSARTHAVVVNGLLRAAGRGQAFSTVAGRVWLSTGKKAELAARISALNELAGYKGPVPQARTDVLTVTPTSATQAHRPGQPSSTSGASEQQYLLKHEVEEDPAAMLPLFWNGRAVARRPWELRATRRYEYREVGYLREMLLKASSCFGAREGQETWDNWLQRARENMGLLTSRSKGAIIDAPAG